MPSINLQGTANGNLTHRYKMIEGQKKAAFPPVAQVRCDPPS